MSEKLSGRILFEHLPAVQRGGLDHLAVADRDDFALVGLLGGEDTPAVGFSFGVERVAERVAKLDLDLEPKITKDVYLVQLGDMARRKVMKVFDSLIDTEISVGESVGRGSIKSQLRMANKTHAKLALIIGQKEAIDNTVIVRDMKSGMQETVMMEDIVKDVRRMLKK